MQKVIQICVMKHWVEGRKGCSQTKKITSPAEISQVRRALHKGKKMGSFRPGANTQKVRISLYEKGELTTTMAIFLDDDSCYMSISSASNTSSFYPKNKNLIKKLFDEKSPDYLLRNIEVKKESLAA